MNGERFASNEPFYQPELEIDWVIEDTIPEEVDERSDREREDAELEQALYNIWDIAGKYHLDPYPTHFEVAPAKVINQIAGYGVPGRFSHWTFGREFDKMRTQYEHGLAKIYELVVNSNPSEAFLLENNPPIENKFVMAHVLGHTDFFKNNFRFKETRDDMLELIADNAKRLHRYEDEYGRREVEILLDAVMSLDQHIDPYAPNRLSGPEEQKQWEADARRKAETAQQPKRPGEFDDIMEKGIDVVGEKKLFNRADMRMPPSPDSDILGYIRNHAPYLEDWQRDVVDIVRSESIYFFPQRRTKIMNEGWAAYWHKRIMREMSSRDLISDADNEAWWKLHAKVVSEGKDSLNPYHLGMKMYEYLEDYYNGNLTVKETKRLEHEGKPIYPHFDGPLEDSPASSKLREVMMLNDDQSIIRNHFDKNFAERMHYFVYEEIMVGLTPMKVVKESGWKDIRDQLVMMLDSNGTPYIEVIDGNYEKSGQLSLRHAFDGRSLDPEYINKTLPHLYTLWQRPVYLETFDEQDKKIIYSYDGIKVTKKDVV